MAWIRAIALSIFVPFDQPVRNMNKLLTRLRALPNTLRFNFHYFPWRLAIRLPVSVSHNVRLERLMGRVLIANNARRGKIKLGFAIGDTFVHQNPPLVWKVDGDVRFGGSARLGDGCFVEVLVRLCWNSVASLSPLRAAECPSAGPA